MKIIFLDIDGVINPWKKGNEKVHWFDKESVNNFLMILNAVSDASIVITSTWRLRHSEIELKEILKREGIDASRIIGFVPDLRREVGHIRYYPSRDEEIRAWLAQNPGVSQMAIIDDDELEDKNGLEADFFKTDFYIGLTQETAREVIEHLK